MDFLAFLQAMAATDADFVIVGGVAARLHGSTRLTHDVDVVPRLEAESWRQLVAAIWAAGGRPRIPESQERISDLGNVQDWITEKGMLAMSFRSPDGSAEVDLLVAESARIDDLLKRAVSVELDQHTCFVASIDDLIRMNTSKPSKPYQRKPAA